MRKIIIGGNFGKNPKASSIIKNLGESLQSEIYNGGTYNELEDISAKINQYDLVIWMPNIDNSLPEITFHKKTGSVLIVSKAIRDNTRSRADAVERIFKYHGNGVIAIEYGDKFKFTLIDALNNNWAESININDVASGINNLFEWTKGAKREGTMRVKDNLDKLISINKDISQEVIDIQGRFFGNLSTRCSALFPTKRINNGYMVSGRNTDKKQLLRTDMVECFIDNNKIKYLGDRKPSVDTPIQIAIYEECPNINYMIHGHNFIKGAPSTKEYFPCGDKREVPEILNLIGDDTSGVINLKNHGFLIYSETLTELEELCNNVNINEI